MWNGELLKNTRNRKGKLWRCLACKAKSRQEKGSYFRPLFYFIYDFVVLILLKLNSTFWNESICVDRPNETNSRLNKKRNYSKHWNIRTLSLTKSRFKQTATWTLWCCSVTEAIFTPKSRSKTESFSKRHKSSSGLCK